MNVIAPARHPFAMSPDGLETTQLRPFPSTRLIPSCQSVGGPGGSAEPPAHEHTTSGEDPPSFAHGPVMLEEVLEVLAAGAASPAPLFVDATLGGGGHTEAILESIPGSRVVGLDRDDVAIDAASERLARFGDRFEAHRVRFDEIGDVVETSSAAGVLFDLGVSSPQIDVGSRGFSFRTPGPLDMRMDQSSALSAHDVVNGYAERDLASLIHRFGDERYARRVAAAIVAARPIDDTARLADVITNAIPAPARRNNRQPAARTFQAIRIEVNAELDVLEPALLSAIDVLAPGGRLAVLSYHSGEDRIVKRVLRDESRVGPIGRPDLPPPPGASARLELVFSGGRTPGDEERAINPRANSARLRAATRTAAQHGGTP